jgi:MFS family permease
MYPGSGASASLLLGRKLDSIPFSIYHVQIILVLGVVGFVEGYDLALSGSLLVLAKEPLHLTPEQIRWLAVAPILFLVIGTFAAASISDRFSRKTVMQIGVVSSTFFTLLIPLTQTGTQLLVIRLLTGFGAGFAVAAPFPGIECNARKKDSRWRLSIATQPFLRASARSWRW